MKRSSDGPAIVRKLDQPKYTRANTTADSVSVTDAEPLDMIGIHTAAVVVSKCQYFIWNSKHVKWMAYFLFKFKFNERRIFILCN